MDYKLLIALALAQLAGLGCCNDAGDSPVDTGREGLRDVESEREPEQGAVPDDLETQETGWLIDEKIRKLEYLKNKVLSPFSGLKSPSYGGGGGALYPAYGGGKPGFSYGGGFSPSFSYGANFNPSLSYGANFNPGISFGGGLSPGGSFGGSSGFYPYKKKLPFIGGGGYGGYGGYAPAYPIQPFPNKFNLYQKFNPVTVKQLIPAKPWYSSSFNGGIYRPAPPSYAPDCTYVVYRPPPTYVQPAPVYSTGTPLSSYYSTAGPSQTYGGKSAYLSGSAGAQVSFQSSPPSPVLQVPAPQLRDGSSSWQVPSPPSFPSAPTYGALSGYQPTLPNAPSTSAIASYAPSVPSPQSGPSWSFGSASYPSGSPQSAPSAGSFWNYQPSFPGAQYIVVRPQGSDSSFADQGAQQEVSITPAPPQARVQVVTALPGVGYPGAIYFGDQVAARDESSEGAGEGQPPSPQSSATEETSEAHSESSESSTASPPPSPQSPSPATPQPPNLLATYYQTNTIDKTRIPAFFYVQPGNGGYYSSPGYGYSYFYAGSSPVQTNLPVTPAPPC